MDVDPNEYIPVIWEDDYCQIEIVPIENKEFIESQVAEINNQVSKSKTLFGFSNVYERKSKPKSTLSKEIRVDYMEYTLSGFGLPKVKHINYEESKIIDCQNSKIMAYGYYNFTIFFDTADDFVKNIWLKTGLIVAVKQFELIESVLYTLGEENECILIDWNSLELVDLRNRDEIDKYLMRNFK